MSNREYVSFETATLMKAACFDWECNSYYINDGVADDKCYLTIWEEVYNWNGLCLKSQISAPTLWQAQKWLRDVKHISIRVSYLQDDGRWFSDWLNIDTGEFDDWDESYATYEEALDGGIKSVLEMIKDK